MLAGRTGEGKDKVPSNINITTEETFVNDVTRDLKARVRTSSSTNGDKAVEVAMPNVTVMQYPTALSMYITGGSDVTLKETDDRIFVTFIDKNDVYVTVSISK